MRSDVQDSEPEEKNQLGDIETRDAERHSLRIKALKRLVGIPIFLWLGYQVVAAGDAGLLELFLVIAFYSSLPTIVALVEFVTGRPFAELEKSWQEISPFGRQVLGGVFIVTVFCAMMAGFAYFMTWFNP
ncbi:MAG: hypothetical protein QGI45_11205 [Myxococcota bacterium]|jgi:hypothetical protein|nr:hypothetical protein [Myxococcota bacterium]